MKDPEVHVSYDSEESVEFADDSDENEAEELDYRRFAEAVVFSTDWTTETLVSQMERLNIGLKPKFQRRDAWDKVRKSRFIESLILGLPIPQIVLAEEHNARGRYLVLDGKQRLLALLHFWGLGEGSKNAFALSGLDVRKDLIGKSYSDLKSDPEFSDELRALQNQPIRTVVIRNWPDQTFLHVVFLRLNTGSVKLSPQELRQALLPGPFSDYVDDRAANSQSLKRLLGLSEPDYRMRDIELLARHLAFALFLSNYSGRMKSFLDCAFKQLNDRWLELGAVTETAVADFESAIDAMLEIFTKKEVARKPKSRVFNKALFDILAFFLRSKAIRDGAIAQSVAVRAAYKGLFADQRFVEAIERDTASTANTVYRLQKMGNAFAASTGVAVTVPQLHEGTITFAGFSE